MKKLALVLFLFIQCFGCGGGDAPDRPKLPGEGGDSSSNQGNAAEISIDASPRRFDSGDITTVNVRLTKVQSNFMLKLRTHESFRYIEESAVLLPDNAPLVSFPYPVRVAFSHGYYYIVIDVNDYTRFGESVSGYISIQLRGRQKITSKISVDIDRKAASDPEEGFFDPASPNFSNLADVEVEVEEQA
ncbi:MAG: hypothetical protein KDD62_03565 [Bdellovibrionales bacterium]|nr:hypothetical protein [Bdellovibrionales bacterium]